MVRTGNRRPAHVYRMLRVVSLGRGTDTWMGNPRFGRANAVTVLVAKVEKRKAVATTPMLAIVMSDHIATHTADSTYGRRCQNGHSPNRQWYQPVGNWDSFARPCLSAAVSYCRSSETSSPPPRPVTDAEDDARARD